MLGVFSSTIVSPPEELVAAGCRTPSPKISADALMKRFLGTNSSAVSMQIGDHVQFAYSHQNESALQPRSFAVKDEIFCLFEGALDNLGSLKQEYGLAKSANEVMLSLKLTRLFVTEHLTLPTIWLPISTDASLSLFSTFPPPPCLWLQIKLVRYLFTGESRPTDTWPLPIMLICLKVPVANLLLLSLKAVSSQQQLENLRAMRILRTRSLLFLLKRRRCGELNLRAEAYPIISTGEKNIRDMRGRSYQG
ncbi:hypothetical protein F3Y22_tig00110480pilonHSYRG00016 [Hibiscus syriacus]|uniref:DUF3700 domain-containing protein n=1 Tax=Hibiscus syriacus TaxID=106335 RepID=A0A6A3AHU6_HIBSY|nr:hypothetical protein F3Y22_tig00110480pilonHSYRG00016 [Hibiscus syriacus]